MSHFEVAIGVLGIKGGKDQTIRYFIFILKRRANSWIANNNETLTCTSKYCHYIDSG